MADAAATPTPYLVSLTRTVYTYDDLGRLHTVQVVRRNGQAVNEDPTTYIYNKNGSQEKVIYPNVDSQGNHVGNEAVYEYDGLNRLVRLTNYKDSSHVEGQLLSRFEYSCYANGQRATAVETRTGYIWTGSANLKDGRPKREIAYQYDGLGRLTREQRNGNDPNEFAYDLVGNRVTQVIGGKPDEPDVTTHYGYNDRDQLQWEGLQSNGSSPTITYGYDNNGSLTSQTTFQNGLTAETVEYVYNLRGRLKQVTTTPYTNGIPGTPVVTLYAYDPSGNRGRKQVGTGTPSVYLIDPMNPTGYSQVLQETTGSTTTTYTLGSDVIGQTTGSADPYYLLYDGHGSVRNHAAANGSLIWFDLPGEEYDGTDDPTDQDYTLYTYDACGQECRRPTTEGLYYSGEMYDQNLAMYNLRARYYNPANGRFNATDPYAGSSYDPQSLHKYLYCHADPVNGIDPTGFIRISPNIRKFLKGFGIYEGLRVLIGIRATYVIGGQYQTEVNPDARVNRWISTTQDMSLIQWVSDFMLRPDIVDHDFKTVMEIKRDSGRNIKIGRAQVAGYIGILALRYPGELYSPGTWPEELRFATIVGLPGISGISMNIMYRNVGGGVIVYETIPSEETMIGIATALLLAENAPKIYGAIKASLQIRIKDQVILSSFSRF